jgi:hypothetical protein
MFSSEPPLSIRPEVQKYMRACEHLLAAVSFPDSRPLSEDEQRLIEFYRAELVKVLGPLVKK